MSDPLLTIDEVRDPRFETEPRPAKSSATLSIVRL